MRKLKKLIKAQVAGTHKMPIKNLRLRRCKATFTALSPNARRIFFGIQDITQPSNIWYAGFLKK